MLIGHLIWRGPGDVGGHSPVMPTRNVGMMSDTSRAGPCSVPALHLILWTPVIRCPDRALPCEVPTVPGDCVGFP